MKLDTRRVEAFLRDPGSARVVLLHGEDAGLIRERAARLVKVIAGSLDDPFRVAELERDTAASIADEMASLPLTGGRRVVRMREASDSVAAVVRTVLAGNSGGFLVLEAAVLTARSKLRTLVEQAPDGAVISCYPQEGRSLEQAIQGMLSEFGVTVNADALGWLGSQLGGDQGSTRAEIEKLALYVGRDGTVDASTARAVVGDLAGLVLDDALFAATIGDVAEADRALELTMAEGAAPVAVLRGALLHLQRLLRARLAMTGGTTAAEAAKGVRPPLFFRREPAFVRALALWSVPALDQASARIWEAERSCKRTGAPAEVICRNVVIGVAQRAAAARRR